MVKGMVNQPQLRGVSGYDWNCASGNPSPAYHPNGTLYAAMRHNPCWKGFQTREHIGIWRADNGWDGEWTPITNQPIFIAPGLNESSLLYTITPIGIGGHVFNVTLFCSKIGPGDQDFQGK